MPATLLGCRRFFRSPVDQAPSLNDRNAGSSVPIKYAVTGLQAGQTVMLDSEPVDCVTLTSTGAATPIQTSGEPKQQGDEYHVNWETDAAWAGSCRRLTIRISGASSSVAYFRFR